MTAPSRVGRYAIVRRLSRGMTDVYLAVEDGSGREVALKLVATGSEALAQMTVEAERRGAAIQKELRALDPRVIEVYEFGDAAGYFFVAMQYVEGRNLAQALQSERRMDAVRAVQIAVAVAGQLDRFQRGQPGAAGVVHGDIKPSNIHLGADGQVRLLDFGIAKMLRADRDATLHNFGSPGYCSPERLARLQVDHQSDLWSLGATLYEMLAGRPPYQAENTEKLEKVIQARRPPRALPEDCPPPLRAVVAKALAPEPADRYRTAAEFNDDLEAILAGRETVAEAERPARWSSPPTLEVAREYLRRVTRTIAWRAASWRAAEGAIWFVLGMGLWIGGSAAYQAWRSALDRVHPPLVLAAAAIPPAPMPAPSAIAVLRAEYLRTADRIIDGYRNGSDMRLREFDWRLAEANLERLVELGAHDDEVLGKLALSRGYSLLARSLEPHYVAAARDAFQLAAARLPRSPDPHLGLARLYVYGEPDIDKAFAAMRAAASLGYRLGQKEVEQQADAWRIRAERAYAQGRRERARRDAERARTLYAQVKGIAPTDKRVRSVRRISARPQVW